MYLNGKSKINKIFDLLSISKKIHEFEILEKLYLTNTQISLIQTIRPKISSRFDIENNSNNLDTEEKIKNDKDLILNFNPVSDTDKKIYEILN